MYRAVIVVVVVAVALVIPGCNSGSANPELTVKSKPAPSAPQAQSTPQPQPPPHRAPGDASADADLTGLAGKPLYLALCAPCHGAEGKGYVADRAPSLVNPTFLESASDEFLRRAIVAGRPGTSMAAYSKAMGGPLDDAGVGSLVAFLREQGPPQRPLPPPSIGDLATGSAVYAKHCFNCHGDAKTRGEAPSLANQVFQATATAAFVRHAVVAGRPGTKMEAFTAKLSDTEIDSVVSYVRGLGSGGVPMPSLLAEPTGKEPIVIHPSGKHPSFTPRAETCPPPMAGAPPCKPEPRFVSVEQVGKALAAKQRMVIIDARPPSEWMRVHITGAVSIPYHDMKRLDEVPKDGTWVIAYCGCPHHLSGIVVDELRKRGYAHAVVLDEGINEWHRRGLPVVAAEGVTAPPEVMMPQPRR
ncbi:MAG TPA: c-type cytochrome [Kofleriaceae bacterium]|nr:c-type cytochrome [Kofleriaceae bacterium]